MAMINVWYPRETSQGISKAQVKDAIREKSLNVLRDSINVGHVSMLLDRAKTRNFTYVSYWPQPPGSKPVGWKQDCEAEGRLPDVGIAIDLLDEDKIANWWVGYFTSNKHDPSQGYDFIRENCADIVARAMKEGGAEDFVKAPAVAMWTPSNVESWSIDLLSKDQSKTKGVFRLEGIGNWIDHTLRRTVSEIGERVLPSI